MILQLADFSCSVANWDHKCDNLSAIAAQLDLNLDALVFVDDRPAERAAVRRFLPEVAVPDLPDDPAGYIRAVALHRYTETIGFTREDLSRARYYSENVRRQEMAASAADIHSFLASLRMRMKVEPVNALNRERVAQLINKSNQFNLTTRRRTPAQVGDLAAAPDWHTATFSLRDELGDNGLISVVLLHQQGQTLLIDTWVMSCRVLQRGVEQFVRNELVTLARAAGCDVLQGIYLPTAKNGLVKDHFAGLGFEPDGVDGEQTLWSLRVTAAPPLPHHIQRETSDE